MKVYRENKVFERVGNLKDLKAKFVDIIFEGKIEGT